jgi:hypothetical protein
LDILAQQAAMLQDKISRDAADLQASLHSSAAHSALKGSTVSDWYAKRLFENEDAVRSAVDAWKHRTETNAGNLQDAMAELMDLRAQRFEKLMGY